MRASFSTSPVLRLAGALALGLQATFVMGQTAPDEGVRFQPPSTVMLQNAHVVVSPRKELESASLIIADGKITAVGAHLQAPAGAEVIDLEGKYVYPALIDAMLELGAADMEYAAGYWNESVTPQKRMDQVAQLDAGKMQALRKAGVGIALAAPNNGIIKGQSCVLTTSGQALQNSLLRNQAFQHVRLFPSRGSRGSYPNSPMGAVALIRQALSDADWYGRAQRAVDADSSLPTPEYDAALIALAPAIAGQQTLVIDGSNELYAMRADSLAREFSLKAIIRGSGREYRQMDGIVATNRAYIIPVNFPDAPEVTTRLQAANTSLQELMHWRLAPENPARLEAAGVRFVLTADGLDKPSDLLARVRTAIEHGLSEEAALRALTTGPAELLEIESLAGTLEAGKLANLIITTGPLFDKSTKIDETWVQGRRDEWNPSPIQELSPAWTLSVADKLAASLVIQLSGKPEKLKGKLGLPDAFDSKSEDAKHDAETQTGDEDTKANSQQKPSSVELKNLKFNGYQLTATFEAGDCIQGKSGAAILGAALLPGDSVSKLVGTITWADGSESSFEAVPTPKEDSDKEDSDKEDSDKEDSDKEDSDKEDSDKEDADKDTQVACDVNYPLGAYGLTAAPEQPEWMLVQNATLWTSGEAGILESADLLVHNGMIEAVGTGLDAPEGATIIDATGMHVTPGIIDCHSHMGTDGGVNESAQAITAEVRIGDFIDPNDITIYRQLAGGVTTANILHGSANPIGGQNQVIKLRWGSLGEEMKMRNAPAGIKFALGENVKRSNSRSETVRYPASRMGVEQIMRDRFEAAKLYRAKWNTWTEQPRGLPPRRDWELEAIAEIVEGKRWIHCHSYRADEILTMLRTLDDYDITIGSLQHILEGYKVADAMAKHGATGSSFSDWWAYKFEVYDAIPYNGALMHEAGVVVSFNSDDDELARHLNHEAAKAVKYGGVSPAEALKFVTLNPAKQLRIDAYVGSLEVGKHADFVIWNRSPLSTLSACTQTWIDGRKYFDREQDLLRRQEDAQLHRELVQSIISTGAKMRSEEDDSDPSYWWARHDEFCHHKHEEHDEEHEHHDEAQ